MTDNILWTSKEVKTATGGNVIGEFKASGVAIDVANLKQGDIYISIKGDNVEEAFKKGAAAAIVKNDFRLETIKPLVYVEDTQKALESLSFFARKRSRAKVIAVTGSTGKAGTRELLDIAFKAVGDVYVGKSGFNNLLDIPLALANMPSDKDYAIFEMRARRAGELQELTKQVIPQVAIITTVEAVHIEHFDNILEAADAQAEIFSNMDCGSVAILNIDTPYYLRLKASAEKYGIKKIFSFGEDEEADCQLVECNLFSDSIKITTAVLGARAKYKLSIPGKHVAVNSLSVLLAAKILECDLDKMAKALSSADLIEGRGNHIKVDIIEDSPPIIIIDESYSANPSSMLTAFKMLETTSPQGNGRRIAILGDMLDLGRDGPKIHMELMNPLLISKADLVFCCGSQMGALFDVLPQPWQGGQANSSQELALAVVQAVKPGDVILVKGAALNKLSYVVQALEEIKMRKLADVI